MRKEDALPHIAETFAERFKCSSLRLPRKALTTRARGVIMKKGWLIQYLFGKDERGEYLDYYSYHRFSDGDHLRIRADGSTEQLEFMGSMIFFDRDDPEGQKKAEEEFYRENRRIARMLLEKGFDRFSVNMVLEADLIEEHSPLPDDLVSR